MKDLFFAIVSVSLFSANVLADYSCSLELQKLTCDDEFVPIWKIERYAGRAEDSQQFDGVMRGFFVTHRIFGPKTKCQYGLYFSDHIVGHHSHGKSHLYTITLSEHLHSPLGPMGVQMPASENSLQCFDERYDRHTDCRLELEEESRGTVFFKYLKIPYELIVTCKVSSADDAFHFDTGFSKIIALPKIRKWRK